MGGTSLACLIAALVLAQAALAVAAGPEPSSPRMTARAAHGRILIDGDAAFTAANGVTVGSGTAADPPDRPRPRPPGRGGDGFLVPATASGPAVPREGRRTREPPESPDLRDEACPWP